MSDTKRARMANTIATFPSCPQDLAVVGIRDHIVSFWTPKMHATLRGVALAGGEEWHPLAVAAATHMTPAPNPVGKEVAGLAEVGKIAASDAG